MQENLPIQGDRTGDVPVIADTLRKLHQSGQLTIDQMSDLLNLSTTSIYRYFGETDLRVSQLRALFRGCGDLDVQAELLAVLLRGTPWMATHLGAELDYDGDGVVDTDDAVKCAVDHLDAYSAMLQEVYASCADGRINDEQMTALQARYDKLVQGVVLTMRIIADQHRRQRRRRKARPVTVGGGA